MNIPYSIEHTRNRSSSAVITEEGVLIRLAGRLSLREEGRHIAILLKRMAKRYSSHRSAPSIAPFRSIPNGSGAFSISFGDGSTRTFEMTEGSKTSAKMKGEIWMVRRDSHMTNTSFRTFLWRLVSLSEQPRIETLVQEINERTFRAHIARVRLRHMKSRFGSCTRGGRITLNTALLFVPQILLESVIIHELAHVLHPNHSRAFWAAVTSVMPEYKEHRKALLRFRLRGG